MLTWIPAKFYAVTQIALESCAIFRHVSDLAPVRNADSDLLVGLVTLPCCNLMPQKIVCIQL